MLMAQEFILIIIIFYILMNRNKLEKNYIDIVYEANNNYIYSSAICVNFSINYKMKFINISNDTFF